MSLLPCGPVPVQNASLTPQKTHISASLGHRQHPRHASPGGMGGALVPLPSLPFPLPSPPVVLPCFLHLFPAPPSDSPLGITSPRYPPSFPLPPPFSIFPQQQPHPGASALHSFPLRTECFPPSSKALHYGVWDTEAL